MPKEFCCGCVGEMMYDKRDHFIKSGNMPIASWVNKAKSSRFGGSEKAFSTELKKTIDKLEQVRDDAMEDKRTPQEKTEDENLLRACKEVYNSESFQSAVDWCSQMGKGNKKLTAFILYGKTKVEWEITLKRRRNYRMLYVFIKGQHPDTDLCEDSDEPDAIQGAAPMRRP